MSSIMLVFFLILGFVNMDFVRGGATKASLCDFFSSVHVLGAYLTACATPIQQPELRLRHEDDMYP